MVIFSKIFCFKVAQWSATDPEEQTHATSLEAVAVPLYNGLVTPAVQCPEIIRASEQRNLDGKRTL